MYWLYLFEWQKNVISMLPCTVVFAFDSLINIIFQLYGVTHNLKLTRIVKVWVLNVLRHATLKLNQIKKISEFYSNWRFGG